MTLDYYEPRTLRGVIKKVHPVRTFFKSRFFNETVTFPTTTVSFEFYENKGRLAPFANPRLASTPINRDGYEVKTYETPYISPSRVITNDTLAQKLLGEMPINSGVTPAERAAKIAANDLSELLDAIARREEYMCARVKQDGVLQIKAPGINDKADFNFRNIEVTDSSNKWTASYDIIAKLREKADILRKSGISPNMLILGTDAAATFMDNNKILKLLDIRRVDVGEIKPEQLENGVEYLGRLAMPGLFIDIYSYNEFYYDEETGQSLPYLDTNCAILQNSRESNYMLHGAVTYINPKSGEYVTEMNEFVPMTWSEINPPVKHISVTSRPLPMPVDITSWYVLKEVV